MNNDPDKIIENGVAELYSGFFKLREAKKYQEEYDAMGVLINMLSTDRQHMRTKYELDI